MPVDCTLVSLKEYSELKRKDIECKCLRSGVDQFLLYLSRCREGDSVEQIKKMAKILLGEQK